MSHRYPQDAACRDEPLEMWFSPDVLPAILICNVCPVRRECLADADQAENGREDTYGVRGGLTARERERRRIWLRRRDQVSHLSGRMAS